jgi:hypothetical protein
MSATVEVSPGEHIPLKCKDHDAAGVPRTDCTEPGSSPRCMLCPASPTFWLRAETTSEGAHS